VPTEAGEGGFPEVVEHEQIAFTDAPRGRCRPNREPLQPPQVKSTSCTPLPPEPGAVLHRRHHPFSTAGGQGPPCSGGTPQERWTLPHACRDRFCRWLEQVHRATRSDARLISSANLCRPGFEAFGPMLPRKHYQTGRPVTSSAGSDIHGGATEWREDVLSW